MIQFTVPLVPPGVNHYVKHTRSGRHYVTSTAKAFKEALAFCSNGKCCEGKTFYCDLRIVLGAKDRGDVDGFPKLVLDGLADAGVFRDKKGKRMTDAHVVKLLVELDRDERPKFGRTEIRVEAIK